MLVKTCLVVLRARVIVITVQCIVIIVTRVLITVSWLLVLVFSRRCILLELSVTFWVLSLDKVVFAVIGLSNYIWLGEWTLASILSLG